MATNTNTKGRENMESFFRGVVFLSHEAVVGRAELMGLEGADEPLQARL